MKKLIEKMAFREQELVEKRDEDGLSLLEIVIAVAIIAIFAVVGIVGFQSLTDNAREAALDSAANQVLTAAIAADNQPGSGAADVLKVAEDYVDSAENIQITIGGTGEALTVEATDPTRGTNSYTAEASAPGEYSHITETSYPAGGGE